METIRNLLTTANKSRIPTQVSESFEKLVSLMTNEEQINFCIESGGIAASLNSLPKPQKNIQLSALKLLAALSNSLDVRRTLEKQNK